ncbi:ankyrin repeat domain-containing protein [Sphingomonas sp.]|uniref:ankyrin repeat domain-containing protein n=1 Tax=Sphingomonas sp. TaxID=28214 RepID=UPI0039C937E7
MWTGRRPRLFAAATDANITLLREYLDAGFDVNYHHRGDTALSTAVAFKRAEAVRYLLERGADPAVRPMRNMSSALKRRVR